MIFTKVLTERNLIFKAKYYLHSNQIVINRDNFRIDLNCPKESIDDMAIIDEVSSFNCVSFKAKVLVKICLHAMKMRNSIYLKDYKKAYAYSKIIKEINVFNFSIDEAIHVETFYHYYSRLRQLEETLILCRLPFQCGWSFHHNQVSNK
jgi:hypothetical protein